MRIWLLNDGRAPLFRSEPLPRPLRESHPYAARASSQTISLPPARSTRIAKDRRGGEGKVVTDVSTLPPLSPPDPLRRRKRPGKMAR